jgi:NDP-sugar pyrophosphorylase family protein
MIAHALILTAGLGTRLRPLTDVRAKPAVPVAGEPIVRRIIRWLARQHVTEIVLNLHHLPQTLSARVGDGSDLGVRVRYSWEQPEVLGSAGGPRRALPIIGSDTFFLLNGDTMTDLALEPLADAHQKSGALVTMALMPNREPNRYGGVTLTPDGSFSGFVNRGDAALGSYHFIGVQAVRAGAFGGIPDGRVANAHAIYEALVASNPGCIRGHLCDAAFWDIGTPADYWETNVTFLGDQQPERAYGEHVRIESTSRVMRSVLWDDVEVQGRAVLEDCIVTDGVTVQAGSTYRRSILVRDGDNVVATPLTITANPGV